MKGSKRLLAAALAASLLCAALAMPGRAAGETLRYLLEPSAAALGRGERFTLTVSLETRARPAALRMYLLYDRDCFAWLPGETRRHGAVGGGQFGQRDATGEANKYPAGMDAAQRQLYGVVALQWASMPLGGSDAAALDASAPLPLLTLGFEVKGEAPLDVPRGGFLIAADTEYGYADTPYFDEIPVEGAEAAVQPVPPAPSPITPLLPGIVVGEGNGLLYGFPASLSRLGSARNWGNIALAEYLATDGVLRFDHSAKTENRGIAGTGSQILLRYANDGATYRSYILVVSGDVDGNGVVDLDDYAQLRAMLAGRRADLMAEGSAYRMAADFAPPYDGAPDAADLEALYSAAVGLPAVPIP